eukprot:3577541-Rhodomonas_salina.1
MEANLRRRPPQQPRHAPPLLLSLYEIPAQAPSPPLSLRLALCVRLLPSSASAPDTAQRRKKEEQGGRGEVT